MRRISYVEISEFDKKQIELNYLPMANSVKDKLYKKERSKLIEIFTKVKKKYEGR